MKYPRTYSFGLLLTALCVGVFSFPVYADTVYSQSDLSTETTFSTYYNVLGTALNGYIGNIQMYAKTNGTPATYLVADVNECNVGYTGCTTLVTYNSSATTTATQTIYNLTGSSHPAFNPAKYYVVQVRAANLVSFKSLGDNVTNYFGTKSPWMQVFTVDTVPLQSQVYAVTSPTQLQVTSSTDVTVTFSYFSTGLYDRVGVEITDQTNSRLALRTAEQAAQTLSVTPFSTVLSLTADRAYRVRGYLRDSTSSTTSSILYGPYVDFSTINDQFFTSTSTLVNITTLNDTNASSSASALFAQFSNYFTNLTYKVPWGYLFDIRDIYNSASTSTTDFASVRFNFDDSSISTTTRDFLPGEVTVLSTSTVTTYLSGGVLAVFNTFVSATLWVGLMYAWYSRIKGLSVGTV